MVEAIPALVTDTSIKMFEKYGVFSESELRSRVEIKYENYAKTIHIEALTMIDMASKSIIPAIIKWTGSLAGTIRSLEEIGASAKIQRKLLAESSDLLEKTQDTLEELIVLTAQAEQTPEGKERACFYHETVMPAMQALRSPVDRLEMIVDKDMWPMPSYGDLLFEV